MSEPDPTFDQGVALHQQGDLNAAERTYHAILLRQSGHPGALHLSGVIAVQTGRQEQGIALMRRAIAARPDYAEAHANLGKALRGLGRHEDAIASLDTAILLRPDFAEAYLDRGPALLDLQRPAEALADLDTVIAHRPDSAEAHYFRGNALRALGRHADAVASYDQVLKSRPDHAGAHNNRGIALAQLGRLEEALASYDRALAPRPDHAGTYNNRGIALAELGRLEAAVASYDHALALRPDFAEVYGNRGLALAGLGAFEAALASYDAAIALRPEAAEPYWTKSLARLSMGDYEAGWEMFEWRWKAGLARVNDSLPGLPWLGDVPIEGKTILVCAEQGFGDTLQFCRYVPLLAQRATVVPVVPRQLLRLLSGLEGVSRVVAPGDPLPRFDAWVPIMSLPRAFRTTLETIPATVPYLRADAEQAAAWRQRMAAFPGRKIGLVWSGSPRPEDSRASAMDRRRSITLRQFAPLAAIPGLCLISLQKGEAAAQAKTPPEGLVLHDWTDELDDFADTAALVDGLDLVISVDTSVVHLAGALGKPVWVLNRYDQCWRWLRDRDDSPWYPTARLFRQHSPGDWDSVIGDVVEALSR